MGVVNEFQVKVTPCFLKQCKERLVQLAPCPSTGSNNINELKITKDRSSFHTPVEKKKPLLNPITKLYKVSILERDSVKSKMRYIKWVSNYDE